MPKKLTPKDFKSGIEELQTLVDSMEKGDLTLEQSLEHFERGIKLTKECQKILQNAEQKVKILTEKNAGATLGDFDEG